MWREVPEMRRLDQYSKAGSRKNWQERMGNSVPPLLAKAIATQIRHKIWGGDPLTSYPKTMTYPEILESAWQDHLKPKGENAPTVISTFAGGGGSSLGYSMAGYRELLAIEWDDNAVETFKPNFPDVPVYHGDIAKLSVEECMTLAGLTEPGELDLLDGSPPCQGFSGAGKRILNDPRNQLFREYIRLLRGLQPKAFVMENVPGLVHGKMKMVFAEIMRELKASGYQVRCKKLNAMYFYVPQSRERLIFIGVRDDLEVGGSYPEAESRPVNVREAFSNVAHGVHAPQMSTKVQEIGNKLKPGERDRKWYAVSRLPLDKPAPTVSKSASQFKNYPKLLHPFLSRGLSEGEFKVLGSYPNGYIFAGDWDFIKERIGNSVPPLFMRSIATHIKKHILRKTKNPPNQALSATNE